MTVSAPARAIEIVEARRARLAQSNGTRAACGARERGTRRARAPRPRAAARCAATSAHLVQLAVAMQDHVAAGGERRPRALGKRALQGIHRDVVAHQQALEPDRAANHVGDDCRRCRRRLGAIERAKHNMRGHRHRQRRPAAGTRAKSVRSSVRATVSDHRQRRWLSAVARPWPGNVLQDRQHAAGLRPSATARAIAATFAGSVP